MIHIMNYYTIFLLIIFINNIYASTNVSIISNRFFNSTDCNTRYGLIGNGPQWKKMNGIWGLWIKYNDFLDVHFINNLQQPSTIHAHGQQPPMYMDGVPDLDALPMNNSGGIQKSFYKPLSGTFFLHSHWGFQHELGVSAPLIVEDNPKNIPEYEDKDITDILRLKKYDDVVMYLEDFGAYTQDTKNKNCLDTYSVYKSINNSWNQEFPNFNFSMCMEPSTTTDVNYRFHIANNKLFNSPQIIKVNNTNFIRLRIINAAGFTNYNIQIPKKTNPILIATDSNWIEPYKNTSLWIATAQRLDVLLELKTNDYIYINAFAEGSEFMGVSRLIITKSNDININNVINKKAVGYMSNWETKLQAFYPLKDKYINKMYTLNITGDNGFMSINKKSWQLRPLVNNFIDNKYPIKVKQDQRICIKLVNFNSDDHPIHIHGHFFQLVRYNNKKINGPIRDTIMVPRGNCNNITICLNTIEQKNTKWPIHCHLSWHLAAGMLTSIVYN